ncbi:23S rRNA pseudouridine2605 synthase [Angulomicrobium tetraedrale]|uniref:Pseudouridine synthase n=1 Tax=Ancylobacter tetraedralis TaxID=217068 RepID=A0A839Z8I3_9HYPH|nr:pseudouridine synthase [Ancylobacter tetraedralis]MBB3770658.1 23S rRNA pseudouridine2605 synthase [Ancylobacter tetraedralis]
MPKNTPPRKDQNRVPRAPRTLAPAEPREAERVAKVIARAGLGSRREIEEWILAGRVAVNGEVLESPARTVTEADHISVDGAPLPEKERTRLFLYHKPKGVVTTNFDPEGRPTLFEILPGGLPRLVSVGRLDLNTEGLILLTNDGGLSRVLELPETGWLRRYRVRAKGSITQDKLDALIHGITVEGVHYGPIEALLDRVQGSNVWLTLALREGKNREVRNVLGSLGLDVNRLIRLSYGPFQLGEIAQGAVEEVRTRVLADQLGPELSAAAGADFEGPLFNHADEDEAPRRPAAKKAGYAKPEGSEDRHRRRPIDTEESPERSVTSGLVADRKGRKVLVQRVRSTATEEAEEAPARPARRSDDARTTSRPTREGGGERTFRRRPDGEGAPAEAEAGDAPRPARAGRPERKPTRDRAAAGPRPARPRFEERGPREEPEGGNRPFRERSERPTGDRPFRERSERPAGDRPFRERSERPTGDRPFRERSERPTGDRPFRERSERPAGDRPFRERSERPTGDRPFRERSERPAGDRPFRERSERPMGDRPQRRERSEGARPYRGEATDRPFTGRVKSEQSRARRPRPGEGEDGARVERPVRPPRDLDRPRREDAERPVRRFDRPERTSEDRPPRRERPEGGRTYGEKSFGEKSPGEKRPFREKRSFGDRPERGERPAGKPFGSRPGGERSGGERSGGERAGGGKSFGGKSFGNKPAGGKSFGGKPGGAPRAGGKPGGGKPGGPRSGGKPGGSPGGKPGGRPPRAPRG